MNARVLLAVSLLAFTAMSQAAEVYKWVDSQGKSHFSDRPPTADQGRLRVETVYGIPKNIQERIRSLVRSGVNVTTINGEGRQCVISGDASTHILTVAFVKRLTDEGIGTLSTPLPEDSADHGPETFELHVLLDKELVDWSKAQH